MRGASETDLSKRVFASSGSEGDITGSGDIDIRCHHSIHGTSTVTDQGLALGAASTFESDVAEVSQSDVIRSITIGITAAVTDLEEISSSCAGSIAEERDVALIRRRGSSGQRDQA